MPPEKKSPCLYGITAENSNRSGKDLWGKNQFNSTFPVALCLFMRDRNISPVNVTMEKGNIVLDETSLDMGGVIGLAKDSPSYQFESAFSRFEGFSRTDITDKIDLILCLKGEQFRPYEIKLTVIPDSGTARKDENEWAPELVIRPVSSAYAMMSVACNLMEKKNASLKKKVIKILRSAYNPIPRWDSPSEIVAHADALRDGLREALRIAEKVQVPFLIQPIWRTNGQSLELCEQCFDVFVWSDVAVMKIPVQESAGSKMTRELREVARHVRSLYDVLTTGDYDYSDTYKGMPLGNQTDKAFAMSGGRSFNYMRHDRLVSPAISRADLDRIILGGGEAELKPERRFDAAVVAHMLK